MTTAQTWSVNDAAGMRAALEIGAKGIDPIFGDEKTGIAIWNRGEPAIVYGDDGSYKTTLTHNFIGPMLGFGQAGRTPEVAGLPVHPIPEADKILYLALSRQAQLARSLRRFSDDWTPAEMDEADKRFLVWQEEVPVDGGADPDAFVGFVEAFDAEYVIIDNIWNAFGNTGNARNADAAGQAMNRLANIGVNVLATHHDRKPQGNEGKRPPETWENIHGGWRFGKSFGSITNLFVSPGQHKVVDVSVLKTPDARASWKVIALDGRLVRFPQGDDRRGVKG